MNSQAKGRDIQRYIALNNIQREYAMMGAMKAAEDWVFRPW